MSVTPVSMAVYMATLANGGTRVTPHLLKAVDDGNGLEAGAAAAAAVEGRRRSPRSCRRFATACGWSSTAAAPAAARASTGTTSAGKTGTAQVISNAGPAGGGARASKDLRDNGWFVFFAPRDNPQIAGVVFLEHGIHGAERRVGRASHPRHVLREAGRPAAAAAADARRAAPRLQGSVRARRRPADGRRPLTAMFERRLYYHIDWLLLGGVLLLAAHRRGDDLQHDRRSRRAATSRLLRHAALRHRARPRRDARSR